MKAGGVLDRLTPREELFAQALVELQNSNMIEVEHEKQGPTLESLEGAAKILSKHRILKDVILDRVLEQCSLRFTELACYWRMSEDSSPSLSGEFRIILFYDAILMRSPNVGWEGSSDAERRLYSEFRIIDDNNARSGTGMFAAVRIQSGVNPLEIWYYTGSQGGNPWQAVKMELDYCGYLDYLLLTKGTFGWQYLFTETPLTGSDFRHIATRLKKMVDIFPRIFPQHDYTSLAQRLQDRL